MNAVKELVKSGKTVIGTAGSATGDMVMLADAGFDFLLFDTQHSAVEVKQLIPAIASLRGKQAAPIVRVSANRADLICFALDAGARGIVVPMVNTAEEARAMVRAFALTAYEAASETLRSLDALRTWYHAAWIGRDVPWTPALEAFLRDAVRIEPNGQVDPVPSIEVFGALHQTLGTWRRDYTNVSAPALAIYGTSFFPPGDGDTDLARKLREFEKGAAQPFRRASIDRVRRELRNVRVMEINGRTHMSIGVIAPDALAVSIKEFLSAGASAR